MTEGIIVADNDSMIRSILRSLLSSVGQKLFFATNGEDAVNLASKLQAKLVLLDLGMPRLNGLVACQRIRALPGYDSTPIAILTVSSEPDVRKAAFKAGATSFLLKPFQPVVLLEALSPYLRLDQATHEAVAKAAERVRRVETNNVQRSSIWFSTS